MSLPRRDHCDVVCGMEPQAVNFALTQEEDFDNTLVMAVRYLKHVPAKA